MSLNQVPQYGKTENERLLIQTVNQLILGNGNNIATVTLTANAASTTVKNSRVGAKSFIDFMPTTANAASEWASGAMYVSSKTNGEFTITHANNAQSDRIFVYTHRG